MICPVCKEEVPLNKYLGYYKGPLFIVKGFRCCETKFVENEGFITVFRHDIKKDKYIPIFEPISGPLKRFDPWRLLIAGSEMGRMST